MFRLYDVAARKKYAHYGTMLPFYNPDLSKYNTWKRPCSALKYWQHEDFCYNTVL
jgi:hypothetical protein